MDCVSRQRGAVMVLGLIVLGVVIVAWQHRASLSQAILAQQALDQATVAAAVGVAQLQARTLNAHAMLNRTEMAHQVAMAHLMTIASAWKMRETMGHQARKNNPPIWLISILFSPFAAEMYGSARMGSKPQMVSQLKKAFETHDQLLSGRLRRARFKLNQHFKSRAQTLAQEIVRRNLATDESASPRVSVVVQNADGLLKAVRPMKDRDRWQRWLENVMDEHGYLNSRWHFLPSLRMVYPNCPWMRHMLSRGGYTKLSVDADWEARDNLSFHKVYTLVVEGVCFYREYPMGWAQVEVKKFKDPSERKSFPFEVLENLKGTTFRKWHSTLGTAAWSLLDPFNNHWAELMAQDKPIRWKRRAKPTPWDLDVRGLDPIVTVNAWLPLSAMGQSSLRIRANQPGLLSVNRDLWPKRLKASAAAKVHFDPLDRLTHAQNLKPGLMQPFWTVQQVPVREGGWLGTLQSHFLPTHNQGLTRGRQRLEGPELGTERRRLPASRSSSAQSNSTKSMTGTGEIRAPSGLRKTLRRTPLKSFDRQTQP